jgi:AraC-like DNA-binding protein
VKNIEFYSQSAQDPTHVVCWRASYSPAEPGVRVTVLALSALYPEKSREVNAALSSARLHDMAIIIVQEKYSDPSLSLAVISKALHVSEDYLGRVFKRHSGGAFSKYLRGVRIREAARLLEGSDEGVKAVAAMVGYSDPSHFIRYFHQVTGAAPSKFRRSKERAALSGFSNCLEISKPDLAK